LLNPVCRTLAKLLVVTNPIDGDIDGFLRTVGIDRRVRVVVIGSGVGGDVCSKYLCLDPLKGFEDIARGVLNVVYGVGISSATLTLGAADPLASAALYTMYLLLNTVEPYIGVEVKPLSIVYRDELIEIDFKPRLCLDPRALKILSRIDGCKTCRELSMELEIPMSSIRRRLVNMARNGLLHTTHRGRSHVYCPTTLAKMFAYYTI